MQIDCYCNTNTMNHDKITFPGQHTDMDSQSGPGAGAGYGNKTTGSSDLTDSDTRFGTESNTSAYSGGTSYGSGSTGGAGSGNKLSNASHDTSGKHGMCRCKSER